MKVLHLASFSGNIGDNFNHLGFRFWLQNILKNTIEWTQLEIRDFFWKKRAFDSKFSQYVNQFDLLIIGGGNYFEFWVEESPTGTSLAIPDDVLDEIKIPVFFNALGVDRHQGYSLNSLNKFQKFINKIVNSQKYLVSVRNDGALETMNLFFSEEFVSKIFKVPDPAFYIPKDIELQQRTFFFESDWEKIISINLASDMDGIRFKDFPDSLESFAIEFADFINKLLEIDRSIFLVFIPHIFKDLEIISKLLGYVNDEFRRTRLFVSEYGTGEDHAKTVIELYKKSDLVLGMRFHSNILPITLGIPTIGLFNYPQIEALYKDLDCLDFCCDVRKPGFSQNLMELCNKYANSQNSSNISDYIKELEISFTLTFTSWLRMNKLLV